MYIVLSWTHINYALLMIHPLVGFIRHLALNTHLHKWGGGYNHEGIDSISTPTNILLEKFVDSNTTSNLLYNEIWNTYMSPRITRFKVMSSWHNCITFTYKSKLQYKYEYKNITQNKLRYQWNPCTWTAMLQSHEQLKYEWTTGTLVKCQYNWIQM